MKLEILRTYVTLKANNHKIKPDIMSIGGFTISLDNINIAYDNFDFSGGWLKDCDNPTIEWTCRGGSDVYSINNKTIESSAYYQFDNFKKLPQITKIDEIYYDAYTKSEKYLNQSYSDTSTFAVEKSLECEFYPIGFSILVIDRDTNIEYEIEASDEVLKDYTNQMINEGLLTKAI
jgi:hypothetical protein